MSTPNGYSSHTRPSYNGNTNIPPPMPTSKYPLHHKMSQLHLQPAPVNHNTGIPPATAQNSFNVASMGFNKIWGTDHFDLLQNPNVLPSDAKIVPPPIHLGQDGLDTANCSSDLFRCTLTKVPETAQLLHKSRLPFGILIHPFKDLNNLPIIQCATIVRCRICRTYINPFVIFYESKRWKCNLCYRLNDLPDDFLYDPVSQTFGDPNRRPEIRASTIEYIAPAEYMLRPPQPAIYLFLLDVSKSAVESGYLQTFCSTLASELENLPGDGRTQIGFIAYDGVLHFFEFTEDFRVRELIVSDTEDVFLPRPDNLLANLQQNRDVVYDFIERVLVQRFTQALSNECVLGAALQAAHKLLQATGGRVTVFQATLPNKGPGSLAPPRENSTKKSSTDVQNLNPSTDFYKRLALECSAQQVCVDLFVINSAFVDLATITGICRFSGGNLIHVPRYHISNKLKNDKLEFHLRRYLTRKIGLEAVMRIRCTQGLSVHTFHGNFFVRSTDLLSLPNVNPDAGFGMQISIEENLTDTKSVCFQVALLYTSSHGERRIRVHNLCLPITSNLSDILNSADQQCIVGLLSKMAVDRSLQSSLSDARDALINVAIDILTSYRILQNMGSYGGLIVPQCLKLLPLYLLALLKSTAFRLGCTTDTDDRITAMMDLKTKPLSELMRIIYPTLYAVHHMTDGDNGLTKMNDGVLVIGPDDKAVPASILQLSARFIDSHGAYLLDSGDHMTLLVCEGVDRFFLMNALGVNSYYDLNDNSYELPRLDNAISRRLCSFVDTLNVDRPVMATFQIVRDCSTHRTAFYQQMLEDRFESSLSYHEFLQHLKTQLK